MAKVTALNKKAKLEFDPQANYKWEPTDSFEITGQQLAALYHCLTREINDPQGASVALKYEAFNVILDLFRRGVEQGAIVEMSGPVNEIETIEELGETVNHLFKAKRDPDTLHHNHPNS
jgi:hypothetical protein